MTKIAILNTSILTNFGAFMYAKRSLDDIRDIVKHATGHADREIVSYIGHQSTADILTNLLSIDVPMNRAQFKQEVGDYAIVFKLNGRPEEGKILTAEEIEAIGYEFGTLFMEEY